MTRLLGRTGGIALAALALSAANCLAASSAAPASVAWAAVSVGNKGGQKVVTLTNGNSAAITISSITIAGVNPGDFSIFSKTCAATLPAAASCTANIVFGPTVPGTRTALLTFADSDTNSPQTVALSGLGTAAAGSVSAGPTSLTFPSTTVGSKSASQSVTLSNGLAAAVTIGSIAISGANAADFAVSGTTCGASLAAAASCSASVVFNPTAAGARTGALSFTDAAANSPQTAALSGTGTAPSGSASASPSTLSWATVTIGNKGGPKVVTLTNAGSSAIAINGISIGGANPADFSIFSKTCGTTLAASSTCTATIIFGPSAAGARGATLNFSDSTGNSPQTVALSGLGAAPSGSVTASPSNLAFPLTAVAAGSPSQSVTLSNTLSSAVTLGSIAIGGANPGDFLISTSTCGSSLAPSASCAITLIFRPAAAGSRAGTLSFTDSAANSPQITALTGIGEAVMTVAPLNPTLAINGTLQFTASKAATWAANCGTITSSGWFTAPGTAEPCTVVATATDGGGQTASTTVTTAASISLTPATVNLHALNTQTFTANQPVTWSASCGSISSSGVFTAPPAAGQCTITATATNGTASSAAATAAVDVANYTARKGGGGNLGAQTGELALSTSNVNPTSFGLRWTASVDGWVSAQPLYMNALTVNGAPHNVVFVATANDSVYGFDGDTGAQLWQVSLVPAGATAIAASTVGFTSAPLIGVLGTPVIDPKTNTLYVVSATSEQNATSFPNRLHALDLATGNEKFGGPVLISDPSIAPMHKLQRPGLLLANGNVYVGIGSMQDMQPYHGLLFSFNAQTLAQQAVWVTTPTGSEGGIWMGGAAPAVDEFGNLYVTTGNGTFDGTANFGEAVVKLSPGLQVMDYFAPYNYVAYDAGDVDLGSGAVMVLPDQIGSYPHEAIACGKPTPVYVLNRDNLGGLGATADNIIQRLDSQVGAFNARTNSVQACFTGPAMWGQNVYFGGKYDYLKMFTLDPNTGMLSSTPVSQGSLAYGYPGTEPVVSSRGTADGILWTLDTSSNALYANDANNLATTLFSGSLGVPAVRWSVPTVVNGHVYVGAEGEVLGFGLK